MMNDLWYYNKNLKPQGPLSYEEMRARIHCGDVGPSDLVSCGARGDWKPASEWGCFESTLFPATQSLSLESDVVSQETEWVLLVPAQDGQVLQEGPFSIQDIQKGLRNKKISFEQYVWKAGLSGWCKIKDRPEFSN